MTILTTILGFFTGNVIEKFTGPIERAYTARLTADTDEKKLDADMTIKRLEVARDIAVTDLQHRWSATSLGRYFIVIPFGVWWAAIFLVQIPNGLFGWHLTIIDVPTHIMDMARVLIPAIIIGDAGALTARHFKRK